MQTLPEECVHQLPIAEYTLREWRRKENASPAETIHALARLAKEGMLSIEECAILANNMGLLTSNR